MSCWIYLYLSSRETERRRERRDVLQGTSEIGKESETNYCRNTESEGKSDRERETGIEAMEEVEEEEEAEEEKRKRQGQEQRMREI